MTAEAQVDRAGDVAKLVTLKAEDDPRTIAEMKEQDDWSEGEITEATLSQDGTTWGLTVTQEHESRDGNVRPYEGGFGCSIPNRAGRPPIKAGDTLRLYGPGLGFGFHGADVNGKEVYYRTPWEQFAERVKWLADYDRRKREEFAERKDALDADYEALPDPLKARIDRFREADVQFRVDSERYEMFCCREAAKFAAKAREAVQDGEPEDVTDFWASDELRKKASGTVWNEAPATPEERWLLWAWALNSKAYEHDFGRQQEALACDDGHSGNTFGGAMQLAWALLRGENV